MSAMRKALLPIFLVVMVRGARRGCGGTYTAARGILHTPNFPGPFNVPITCEWVIDSQHATAPNTSIVVYLTQLFVFEGLTFTEYQLYGDDYKIHPRLVHAVNETNVTKVRWVQTFQGFLVIRLKLQSVDSAHLRVLDKFLDVYGFNVTYEITGGQVRPGSCTMMDCGFTGICYDHYTKFKCDCFPGYAGVNCSEGPKSFCWTSGKPTCKNGGTCLHVGVSTIKCHCPKNFTGTTCESAVTASTKDCATCKSVCAYDGKLENACKCFNKGKSNTTDTASTERMGFKTTMHLGNLPNIDDGKLKVYIQKQLLRSFQANFSKIEDVIVNNVVHFRSGADVTFHVFGQKKEEKRLRSILNKWADRGYVGNITISEKDTTLRSLLSLQNVAINQQGTIRESDEFILSCVARGSPTMTFRWFKDGIFINATSTSHKWIKLIKDPHAVDQYTALLAVERAHPEDEGTFTCQVEDFNVQQCMSRQVKIGKRPTVVIEPMSLTVRKGDNFTVKCLGLEENLNGKYTYSWTKNKELLPVRTENEKYEVLYPSGTILQVVNAEKDVHYSCLVQDGLTSSETSISVHVVDRRGIHTCPQEKYLDAQWPETAPDTNSVMKCPEDYQGRAKRYCALKDGKRPKWETPNYSECVHKELGGVRDKFAQLKLGYLRITPEEVLQSYVNYLEKRKGRGILPGEGALLLSLTQDVVVFIGKSRMSMYAVKDITTSLISIVDMTLSFPNSLTKTDEVTQLLEIIKTHLTFMAFDAIQQAQLEILHYPRATVDVTIMDLSNVSGKYFSIPSEKINKRSDWQGVHLTGMYHSGQFNQTSRIVSGVIFRNLSMVLPPRLSLRIKDGSEIEYEFYSQIVNVLSQPDDLKIDPLVIDFKHDYHGNVSLDSDDSWTLQCGYTETSSFPYTWDIYSCSTQPINDDYTRCVCPKGGVFGLLLTLMPPEPVDEDPNPRRYILITGCSFCMVLALFTTACLAISCGLLRKSRITALKLQCSFSVFGTGLLFTLAVLTGPPQNYFMIFITTLEMFFLLGMASHLSKLLIVFTELIQMPKPVTSKYTVIGIISGVPVITVFGSHLSYRTMDIKLESWWMLTGTLAFNIFVTVVSIISILFIFLYIIVMRKLQELIAIHEKYTKPIKKRVALLRRSGFIFGGVTLFSVSSIVYVNYPNKLWSIYQFSIYNIFLGFLLLFCYVFKAETQFRHMFQSKSKTNSEDKFFSFDSTSSPLNFLTKQDPEVENESGPQLKPEQFFLQTVNTPKSILVTKSQPAPVTTFDACLHTSTSFCDDGVVEDLTALHHYHQQQQQQQQHHHRPPLERYNSSPQAYRKSQQSPDILSNKVCVELDLVASSLHSRAAHVVEPPRLPQQAQHLPPKVIITPDDAIAKILEAESVVVPSEDDDDDKRTQPDGRDETPFPPGVLETVKEEEENVVTTSIDNPIASSDKLDGMLDSISHDLDYLLNRSEEADAPRRVSKVPGANVRHKVPEELVDEAGVESVTLRTNC